MDRVPGSLAPGRSVPTIPCVVDVRLSLGAGGLFWVLSLARALPVWLVQAHWAIVDDPAFYLGQEPLVRWLAGATPAISPETCRAAVIGSCESWRLARRDWCLDTHPNLYWPADRSLEAVFPKDGRRGLAELCDALATGLDHRRGRSPETVDALADCGRDTLALAAALDGVRPLVLAALAPDETAPAAARSLEEAGVPCRRLEAGNHVHGFDAALAPALIETGLATALASGALRLAGLQVVAPRAHLPAPSCDPQGDDDRLAWNEAERGNEERLWDDAIAVFWEVRCAT